MYRKVVKIIQDTLVRLQRSNHTNPNSISLISNWPVLVNEGQGAYFTSKSSVVIHLPSKKGTFWSICYCNVYFDVVLAESISYIY